MRVRAMSEIKNNTYTGLPVYTVEHYEASGGHGIHSANTNEDRLGFVRLRVNASNDETCISTRYETPYHTKPTYCFRRRLRERRRTITSSTGASESVRQDGVRRGVFPRTANCTVISGVGARDTTEVGVRLRTLRIHDHGAEFRAHRVVHHCIFYI